MTSALKRTFVIRSNGDSGVSLATDGQKSWHESFADALRFLQLEPPLPPMAANVFDRAYRSEIETGLVFDGVAFVVELQGNRSACVASFDEAERWLDAEIRRIFPTADYAIVDES